MNCTFIYAFFFTLLSSTLLAQDAQRTRVMSLNLHCTKGDWRARVQYIVEELAVQAPEVVMLQEVCVDSRGDMIQFIKVAAEQAGMGMGYESHIRTHRSGNGWEHLMILGKHPAEAEQQGLLPRTPLQRAYLALKYQGAWLVNTHLEFIPVFSFLRSNQIKFLLELWPGEAVAIFGDFNSTPEWQEQQPFWEAGYLPVFPGPTYPTYYPRLKFDGAWLSPELQERLQSTGSDVTFSVRMDNGDHPSDHFGILIDLLWAPNQILVKL